MPYLGVTVFGPQLYDAKLLKNVPTAFGLHCNVDDIPVAMLFGIQVQVLLPADELLLAGQGEHRDPMEL